MAESLESMMALLECPICLEVPRDGIMLQCKRGHNVCGKCKAKLGENPTCPQGRCAFNSPPTRNFTVSHLIDTVPIEFPCRFAKSEGGDASGCAFKGPKRELGNHEASCEYRMVSCPRSDCGEDVQVKSVMEHLEREHGFIKNEMDNDEITSYFLWSRILYLDGTSGAERRSSGLFFPRAEIVDDQVFVWLQMLADPAEARKYKCRITLKTDDHEVSWTAPVYSIDWDEVATVEDKECFRIGFWHICKFLTELDSENEEGEGSEPEDASEPDDGSESVDTLESEDGSESGKGIESDDASESEDESEYEFEVPYNSKFEVLFRIMKKAE